MQYRLPNICVKKDFKRKEANNNGYSSGRKRSGTRNGKIPGSSVVSAQTKHLYAGSTGQAEIERFEICGADDRRSGLRNRTRGRISRYRCILKNFLSRTNNGKTVHPAHLRQDFAGTEFLQDGKNAGPLPCGLSFFARYRFRLRDAKKPPRYNHRNAINYTKP